jgi:ABC-type sugar transport system permease subunit
LSTVAAPTSPAERERRRLSPARREGAIPWMFLGPSILILGALTLYPLGYAIALSFQSGTFIDVGGYVGLENYGEVFASELFRDALRFTVISTVATVAGSYVIGLALALAVNQVRRGRWLLVMGLLLPWVIPGVVSVVAWRWMVADDNAIANWVLGRFGVDPVAFLAEPLWASVVVILLRIWRTFPFMFITLLAARQGVSDELYEAAALDGSGRWASFRHITLPQLARVSIVGSLLVAIWTFNDFESIFLLTRGGPSNATYNLIVLSYYEAFFGSSVGVAAAIGIVGLVLLFVLSFVLLALLRRRDDA